MDDTGLGRTVQVLALLARGHGAGPGDHGPTLIVAPTSVAANWAAEAERFTPGLTVITHHGASRARGPALAATGVAAQIERAPGRDRALCGVVRRETPPD